MELKECPFCGSIPVIYEDKYGAGWGVECQSVICEMTCRTSGGFAEKEDAVEAWNKRSPQL